MNTLVILKKELKVLGNSPSTWWIGAVNLLLTGYFFALIVSFSSESGQLDTQGLMGTLIWLPLAFTSPAYAMRLFADEKRLCTDELLFTSPTTSMGMVLGKWLGASLALLIPLGMGFILYAYILLSMAGVGLASVVLLFSGLLLVSLLYMAIGTFTSTLSDSPPVCLLLHLMGNISLLLLGMVASAGQEGLMASVANGFSLMGHLESFGEGAIELVDLAYFLLFSASLLFMSARRVDLRRMI